MNFGNLMAQFKSTSWIHGIAFSPSGHKLCWVNHDSTVNIVDANADATKVTVYYGKSLPLTSLLWTSEETFLTAVSFPFFKYQMTLFCLLQSKFINVATII